MEEKNKPSKEDIIEYYVNQNHTVQGCADYFGLSWTSMDRLIKKLQICKTNDNKKLTKESEKQKRLEQLAASVGTKENIFDFYIIQNHSIKECLVHYNICKDTFLKVLRFYNIAKTCANGIRDEEFLRSQRNKWDSSYENLYQLYIVQNLSEEEIATQCGVTTSVVSRFLKKRGIYKSQDSIQQNRKETCLKRYGTENPLQNQEIKNKSKETCYKRYGYQYALQSPEVQQKKDATVKERYGVDNVSLAPKIKQKIEQTTIERYGASNVFLASGFQKQLQEDNLKKYGVRSLMQRNILHYDIWENKELFLQYISSLPKKPTVAQLARYFNVESTAVLNKIHSFDCKESISLKPMRSFYEDEIIDILRFQFNIMNIQPNKRKILPSGKEIDIYLPDYKIGIEFNGEYWHCDIHDKFQDHGGRSHYHQNKSLEAESQGIFLFHIFEHEWSSAWIDENPKFSNSRSNIINRLQNLLMQSANKIPARSCEIREVSKEDKNLFLDQNHIQGSDRAGSYTLGLYFNNQLVSCMCFGHSKYEKYSYELTRFATIHDTVIQGGASKLFKYFVEHKLLSGETVVSYNDITKTRGNIYKTLGFECKSVNDPNYWWVNFDTCDIRSRYQEQAPGEVERMHALGYHRICDCGTKTWVYTKE